MPTRQTTDTVNEDLLAIRINVEPPDGSSTLAERIHIEVSVAFDRSPPPPGTDGRFFHTRTFKLTDVGAGPRRTVDGAPVPTVTDPAAANRLTTGERVQLLALLEKLQALAREVDGFA